MAQNISLLGADYLDVPAVILPKTGGGTAQFVDVSDDTITSDVLLTGYTAHDADGNLIVGEMVAQEIRYMLGTVVAGVLFISRPSE